MFTVTCVPNPAGTKCILHTTYCDLNSNLQLIFKSTGTKCILHTAYYQGTLKIEGSGAVMCSVLVRKMWEPKQIEKERKKGNIFM